MKLKNIAISKEVHKLLVEYGDGKSINKTMRQLVADASVEDVDNQLDGLININFDEDIYDKLVQCRVYPNEAFASVIYRLLQSQK